ASIVQSPTTDKGLVIAAINRLRPQRATAIGRAILVSLDAIFESMGSEDALPSSILQQQPPSGAPRPSATPLPAYLQGQHAAASIVLLSDGQNNQFPAPLDVVDQAVSRGVRVYTIGVGSAAGTIVRLQGRAVRTALDEATLKKIADVTDGQYFNANTEADLRQVYENLTTQLVIRNEKTELTAYVTFAAAVLAVLAGAFSLLWFNRLP
ncbi:MAG TPA: VWA domain-containing protein, partial [Mycobacteriales bacterium]|nr:VWA domain-containing protein [Mycobacteriales bacterium]